MGTESISSARQEEGGRGGVLACMRTNLLTILTVTGVVGGVVLGFILREVKDDYTDREVMLVKFVGDLFLRMLKALILPLIVSSLIAAIGNLDLGLSGKIGGRAVAYYMITTVIAVALGIILVTVIEPGKGGTPNTTIVEDSDTPERNVTTEDTLMDLLRNMLPPNLIQATMYTYQTVINMDKKNPTENKREWKVSGHFEDGTNILGLVVFATALGITLGKLGPKGKPLLDVFSSLSEAMMVITNWVIWLSPLGVCFLIAAQLIEEDDLGETFKMLGMYFLTVMAGLTIHGLIILPTIYAVITRTLPLRFLVNMSQALITAFGTSSSTATLPVTLRCLEEKNKVDSRVSRFVIPIGATINMDGTALYEAVAAIWIAQMHGTELNAGNILAISITATAAAIGAAGIPQAGLVTMVMVLNTVGLPAEYVAYVVPVDWLLDRFRTIINVFGDSVGAGVVNHLSRNDLDSLGKAPTESQDGLGTEGSMSTSTSTVEIGNLPVEKNHTTAGYQLE